MNCKRCGRPMDMICWRCDKLKRNPAHSAANEKVAQAFKHRGTRRQKQKETDEIREALRGDY